MKTTEKVITEPQAKKIAELIKKKGIKLPKSEYYHSTNSSFNPFLGTLKDLKHLGFLPYNNYPAYDVAELMEIMKGDEFCICIYERYNKDFYLYYNEQDDIWGIKRAQDNINITYGKGKTQAVAVGDLFIQLLENKKS